MLKISEAQERIESERQKISASLPSQQQPFMASEVVSPKPRRLLGDIASALGKSIMLDRNDSDKTHPAQGRNSIESSDSNARQRAPGHYISEFDSRLRSYAQQSTGGDAKWSLGNAIKNKLTQVGVRQTSERARGDVDARAPAQGQLSTESSDSNGKPRA
jgi:hypothetical protein